MHLRSQRDRRDHGSMGPMMRHTPVAGVALHDGEQGGEWMGEGLDGGMGGWADGGVEWMEGWTDGRRDGWIWMDVRTYGLVGRMDGWIDAWMDGWIGG